jgi:hypothetical protein
VKRHPFDALSFICGMALLALALVVVTGQVPRLQTAWLAPAALVMLGALLLFLGWRSTRTAAGTGDRG